MDISLIDKNFAVVKTIDKTGLKFYDIEESPFRVYGVKKIGDRYFRLPPEVAKTVNPGVEQLNSNTAGGRIRFVTDSKRVAIIAVVHSIHKFSHMPAAGVCGFDLYADDFYVKSFLPPYSINSGEAYEQVISLDGKKHEITINMPLYAGVRCVMVGLEDGAYVGEATDYKYETPIVYYGSSITQGGCASRPGNSYQAILSRKLNANHINLGFSGNAKGEREIAEYIAGLDMSVFVLDYDHNAPTWQHLEATHEQFYKIIREAHPTLPILMVSRPRITNDESRLERLEVIKRTYENAVASGDSNVYFLDASKFFDGLDNDFTVDGTHPTDLGFMFMAKGMLSTLKNALSEK